MGMAALRGVTRARYQLGVRHPCADRRVHVLTVAVAPWAPLLPIGHRCWAGRPDKCSTATAVRRCPGAFAAAWVAGAWQAAVMPAGRWQNASSESATADGELLERLASRTPGPW